MYSAFCTLNIILFTSLTIQVGTLKRRKNGLDGLKMRKKFGGSQSKMRNAIVKEVGPCNPLLTVGDVQMMVFKFGDSGPFYLSATKREATRFDAIKNGETK